MRGVSDQEAVSHSPAGQAPGRVVIDGVTIDYPSSDGTSHRALSDSL